MKKSIVGLLCIALLLGICITGAGAEKKIFIAGLGKSLVPYWDNVGLGIKHAGEKVGAKTLFMAPRMEDVPEQLRIFENFIAQGVDGIVFGASDPKAFDGVVREAQHRGVIVITFDSDAPASGRLVYIGPNNYHSGQVAGETMAKLLNGKGKVAIQVGSVTAINARERIEGFKDAVKKYPGIEIVSTQIDREDPQIAFAQAEQLLAKYPDLAGIYAVYAYNAGAAARAVKGKGLAGKVKIVGYDLEPDTREYLKDGSVQAVMYHREYRFGYLATMALYDMIKFGVEDTLIMMGIDPQTPPEKRIIYTPTEVVTKENIDDYLEWFKSVGIK